MQEFEQDPEHDKPGKAPIRVSVVGTFEGVRDGLTDLTGALDRCGVDPSDLGTFEIVMAEVLNNIVEHAFASIEGAQIQVRVTCTSDGLRIQTRDTGHPMPDGLLPAGNAHDLDVDLLDLPEGGFGWNMIRTLTSVLEYQRSDDANNLNLVIPREAAS